MTFYAQPYDPSATGFSFSSAPEFHDRTDRLRNAFGQQVEEFEIQFIDGEAIDAELAEALGLHQGNIGAFIEAAEGWDEHEKRVAIIAARECGYLLDPASIDPGSLEIDIYEGLSLRDLAIEFVEEGLFGDIPDSVAGYIDYDAIARDLAMDYAETTIAGERLIYRSA